MHVRRPLRSIEMCDVEDMEVFEWNRAAAVALPLLPAETGRLPTAPGRFDPVRGSRPAGGDDLVVGA